MNNGEKKYDVVVVGELNVDLILNEIDSFPEMGKEILSRKMDLVLGSSSAIFASNLSSLKAKVSFLGKIGNDSFGQLVLDSLNDKGVDTSLVLTDKFLKTGATIVMNYGNDRAMITYPGAMENLTEKEILGEDLKNAKHLHLSSPFLQPGFKDDIVTIFKKAKELGLTTSLDPQWDPAEKWDLNLEELLPFVDVFLPNEQELLFLTSEQDLHKALDKIEDFSNIVLVKLGTRGSLSLENGVRKEVKAFLNNSVVDAIGAGDSFNAGFISKFIQGATLETCQIFGNLTGAVNTTASGGTGAFTDYDAFVSLAKKKFGYSVQNVR